MSTRGGVVGIGSAASRSSLVFIVGVSLVIGPPAFVVMLASAYVVAEQRNRHWHEIAVWAFAGTAASFVLLWMVVGNPVGFNYSGYLDWFSDPSLSMGSLLATCTPGIPLGVPAGVGLGACVVGVGEALATGSEWHPLELRRQEVDEQRARAQRDALLRDRGPGDPTAPSPLGVARDGDLLSWRRGLYAVVGEDLGNRGLMVVGGAGSGKTVTAERLVSTAAQRGRRVVFADCKGTDPELAERLVAAYIAGSGRRDVRVHVFPEEPLNGWTGDPAAIVNRLLATQETSEPYYAATLQTVVRLAVGLPDAARGRRCDSSSEFLARLNADVLTHAYAGTRRANSAAALRKDARALVGAALRFEGMFDAVSGGFDGQKSWGDSDLIFLRVPQLAGPADAEAVMRLALADFSQYCGDAKRKVRRGDDITFIVDEFSAIAGLAPQVIDLVERVRDVGGQVIVTAQSWEGLGRDDNERLRVRGAMAGVVLHQCLDPERFCEMAGTERKIEQSWQIDQTEHSGLGSMRMGFRMTVDPDEVRRAEVGEAWAITGGEYLHMHVLPNRDEGALGQARQLVEESRRRGSTQPEPTAEQDEPAPKAEEPPSSDDLWEDSDED